MGPNRPTDRNLGLYYERPRPYNNRRNWRQRPNSNRSNLLNDNIEEAPGDETDFHNSNSFLD